MILMIVSGSLPFNDTDVQYQTAWILFLLEMMTTMIKREQRKEQEIMVKNRSEV